MPTTSTAQSGSFTEDGTNLTDMSRLWFGVRNVIHEKLTAGRGQKLTTPDGKEIPHPGIVLVPQRAPMSTRNPLSQKVQYVDPKLWYQYWRLKLLGRNCRSKYMPHQGEQERERRRERERS